MKFLSSILNYISKSFWEIFQRPSYNLKPLDGLRALAITFVVCMHVNELVTHTAGFSPSILSKIPPFTGGWVGVPLFFVLSGFLIGGQLWKELTQNRNIAFWSFIFRRGFRIWPLYYAVMILVYAFSITQSFELDGLLSNLFFLGNYLTDTGPIFGSWSLATEEQFYIFAPLFLITINKYFPHKNLVFYRRILLVFFFLPIVLRYISWDIVLGMKSYDITTYMKYIYRPFHANCEGLIAGMIISNYFHDPDGFLNKEIKNLTLWLILAGVIFLTSFYSKVYFNFTGVALGFSALLIYSLKARGALINFLSKDFMYVISKTSFAVYLIHIHVIKNLISLDMVKTLSFGVGSLEIVAALILVMFYSVAISIILYLLIEKPFMLLRSKMLKSSL